jgi:regulator of ribonuclease activity A
LINHQKKTASSLASRMLLEKSCVSNRKMLYFIGRCCFFRVNLECIPSKLRSQPQSAQKICCWGITAQVATGAPCDESHASGLLNPERSGRTTIFGFKENSMTTKVATCDLCDVHKNDDSGSFRVLPPVFRDFGAIRKFSGPVVTVKCFEDNSLVKAMLDSPGFEQTPTGRVPKVLVVDGGGSLRKALVGGNLGAAAVKNGWAGVVIDGCVRDVAELASHQVGIRALASMPMPTEKRQTGQQDVAVQIQGVWVRPGDWLYADEDGIVISAVRLD